MKCVFICSGKGTESKMPCATVRVDLSVWCSVSSYMVLCALIRAGLGCGSCAEVQVGLRVWCPSVSSFNRESAVYSDEVVSTQEQNALCNDKSRA